MAGDRSKGIVPLELGQKGPNQDTLFQILSPELIEDWNKSMATMDFHQYMFDLFKTRRLADAVLSVKPDYGEGMAVINAHQSILKYRMEYFKPMFSERWQQGSKCDLTGTGFMVSDFNDFLEYIYTNRTTITAKNASALYHMSTMFCVQDLKSKVEEFLEGCLDGDNALALYKDVSLLNSQSDFFQKITDFIRSNALVIMDNTNKTTMLEFSEIQLRSLFSHFPPDTINTPVAVRFCLNWAAKKGILHQFRKLDNLFFLRLNVDQFFPDFPHLSDLLTFEERYGTSGDAEKLSPVRPNETFAVHRFKTDSKNITWQHRKNHADKIAVRFSEPITLTGIGLYGDVNYGEIANFDGRDLSSKYNVEVHIYHYGKEHQELAKIKPILRIGAGPAAKKYVVDIEPPVVLQADHWYTIAVKISGGQSTWHGRDGVKWKIMRCGNLPVVIEFKDACPKEKTMSNATGQPIGQIPSLHFRLLCPDDDDDIEIITA